MMDNKQLLFGSLQRLQNFPIDANSIFDSLEKVQEYIDLNTLAYEGQIVAVLNKQSAYVLVKDEHGKLYPAQIGTKTEEIQEMIKNSIDDLDNKLSSELNTISIKLDDVIEKIENGNFGNGSGNGGTCNCQPMKPYTDEQITAVFEKINGECGGIEDNIPVIESIPDSDIKSLFNRINGDCGGIEDSEDNIESIPSEDILHLFNTINNC